PAANRPGTSRSQDAVCYEGTTLVERLPADLDEHSAAPGRASETPLIPAPGRLGRRLGPGDPRRSARLRGGARRPPRPVAPHSGAAAPARARFPPDGEGGRPPGPSPAHDPPPRRLDLAGRDRGDGPPVPPA